MFKILLLQGANANYLGKRERAWPCSSPRCRAPWPRDRRSAGSSTTPQAPAAR